MLSFFSHALFSQVQDSSIIQSEKVSLKKKLTEVVVTGQLSQVNAKDAIHKIRVINNKILTSGIFNDLSNVLEKELNVRISQDNILGSSISMQGISGQNVKILINEIPVIGRMNGNIDLSQINLSNIERIEIVEGPMSTIYGSDALGGTINIITKQVSANTKVINTYYESIGKYNCDLLLTNKKENSSSSYSFGRKYFNGWNKNQEFQLIPTNELADTNRLKTWKPKEQFFHKITYNLKSNNVSVNNYFETFYEKITNLGKPREPYYETSFDEYFHTYRTNIGTDINIQNNMQKIRILLAYNKYDRTKETFYTDLTDLSRILVQDQSMQDTSCFDLLMSKIMLSRSDKENLNYQIGLDFQKQSAKGQRINNKYQDQADYAFFSIFEYKLNNLFSVRPSFRLIHNTKYKAPIIPALNILHSNKKYQIRFSYSKGFRAPNLKELYLDFVDINHNIVGNKFLSAEKSNNYSLNTSIENKIFGAKSYTNFSLFYNDISNKIDLTSSTDNSEKYSYFNVDKYITKGMSASTKISLNKIEMNFGISYTGRYNELYTSIDSPEFSYSLDYNLSSFISLGSKMKVNIFYKNTGKMPVFVEENNNLIEVFSEQYSLFDISINRRLYNDIIILSIGAKNLFDVTSIRKYKADNSVHSSSNNSLVGYGRTFFTSLKFNL
ncbi:TonB-dependent receptor [Flavobacteriales bacterium]|nr:TonB-dependent receptor [Flavobacteriales bacterium]